MRQSKRRRSGFLSLLGLLCLSGCANQPCQDDLSRLVNVGIDNASSSLSGIRYTGLRDTALSIGARGGLASRAKEINNEILTQSVYLDRIFNFNALILNDNIVPPVLTQSRQLLEQTEDDSLRLADRSYHIIAQAYFMSSAPTWQDYLLFHCPAPELPDRSLLPKK